MTVRAFLGFCVRVKTATGAERRKQVERVLDECGLSHMARRHIGNPVKGLSPAGRPGPSPAV